MRKLAVNTTLVAPGGIVAQAQYTHRRIDVAARVHAQEQARGDRLDAHLANVDGASL